MSKTKQKNYPRNPTGFALGSTEYVIPAQPGFKGIRVTSEGDYLPAPIVAWLVGSNASNERVIPIAADGLTYTVVEWPDGSVYDEGGYFESRDSYLSYLQRNEALLRSLQDDEAHV